MCGKGGGGAGGGRKEGGANWPLSCSARCARWTAALRSESVYLPLAVSGAGADGSRTYSRSHKLDHTHVAALLLLIATQLCPSSGVPKLTEGA